MRAFILPTILVFTIFAGCSSNTDVNTANTNSAKTNVAQTNASNPLATNRAPEETL